MSAQATPRCSIQHVISKAYLPKPISERELRVWVEMGLHRLTLERRVIESERYLASVLGAVGDAVVGTDAAWKIRDLITAFRDSTRHPFPNWKDSTTHVFMPSAAAQEQFA